MGIWGLGEAEREKMEDSERERREWTFKKGGGIIIKSGGVACDPVQSLLHAQPESCSPGGSGEVRGKSNHCVE